jgi:NAD(P)-dependent dehydrogenase (short-subunit alcohol dehydrogenase family)
MTGHRAVALEVADTGATCNAICPGLVMTDIIRKQLASQAKVLDCTEEEALQRVFLANTPTNRAITPPKSPPPPRSYAATAPNRSPERRSSSMAATPPASHVTNPERGAASPDPGS